MRVYPHSKTNLHLKVEKNNVHNSNVTYIDIGIKENTH